MNSLNFYPESPRQVPLRLLAIPGSYHVHVAAVLIAIILFIALYFAMVAFAAWLIYLAVVYPMPTVNSITILLKLGTVGMAVMFFVFLLKFMFKKQKRDASTDVVLKEKEHPRLFQFLRQLSKETGAPFPKKVIANAQVNAAVFYNDTFWSMFLPVRKNLVIGLGLVNSLNLSEFKSVIAHEFGHFSQRSMKLGSYVYMANNIIHDMVYNRDSWDDTLEKWKRSDFRFAVFGWILSAVIWIVRRLLILIYQLVNLMHASLSRQMEFNADLVAVSVTGSDAIIHSLSKLGRSSQALSLALSQLSDAAQHQLYSSNMFFHQGAAEDLLKNKVPEFADRHPVMDAQNRPFLFTEADVSRPDMYASHPSNYDREQNAKRIYIESPQDERSAWALFDNPEQLQRQVTEKIYRALEWVPRGKADFNMPQEVQAFIEAEQHEMAFNPKYCDTYAERYINVLDLEKAEREAAVEYPTRAAILEPYATLYDEALAAEMQKRRHLQMEMQQLAMTYGQKRFSFRGKEYSEAQREGLMEKLNQELGDQNEAWFKAFDERALKIHLAMLNDGALAAKQEYLERYEFQQLLTRIAFGLQHAKNQFDELIQSIIAEKELTAEQVYWYESELSACRNLAAEVLDLAGDRVIPKLEYLKDRPHLRPFLLEGDLVRGGSNLINQTWLTKLSGQLSGAIQKSARLYNKSMGALIKFQERFAGEYLNHVSPM